MTDIYIYGKVKKKNNLFRILAANSLVYENDKIPGYHIMGFNMHNIF